MWRKCGSAVKAEVLFKIGSEAFYGYGDAIREALASHEAGYALDLT